MPQNQNNYQIAAGLTEADCIQIHAKALLAAMAECLESMVSILKSSNPLYDTMTPFNVVSSFGKKRFKVNVDPEELRSATRVPSCIGVNRCNSSYPQLLLQSHPSPIGVIENRQEEESSEVTSQHQNVL